MSNDNDKIAPDNERYAHNNALNAEFKEASREYRLTKFLSDPVLLALDVDMDKRFDESTKPLILLADPAIIATLPKKPLAPPSKLMVHNK